MKKNDMKLIGALLVISVIAYLFLNLWNEEGSQVVVTVDGVEYGTYNLNEDQVIYIEEGNVLEIQDGEAYMIEADCPDGLCLNQGKIHQDTESIICLPNRVVVEVVGEEVESDYDAVTQ